MAREADLEGEGRLGAHLGRPLVWHWHEQGHPSPVDRGGYKTHAHGLGFFDARRRPNHGAAPRGQHRGLNGC
jgi:hypothetical protein